MAKTPIVASMLALLFSSCASQPSIKKPDLMPQVESREAVVTYHPIATEIGTGILHHGGNAFDAFVAATAAEYVLGEGVTSLAGPLGALLYDVKTKRATYLDATFNDPYDSRQKVDPNNPRPGSSVLVPGAVAGLEALSKKYGRLPFKAVLEPAIKLAEAGFPLNEEYAALLRSPYGEGLKRSAYALKTYFREGQALGAGDTLKLPLVAQFLRNLAEQGSAYVYGGKWAKECLQEVNSQGGHLQLKDFTSYQAHWETPAKISYRGIDIYSPRNEGGLNTLLSLKTLEQTTITQYGKHFSSSAEALEFLARIQLEVAAEPWLKDQSKIEDVDFVEAKLSKDNAQQIWNRVQQKRPVSQNPNSGSHSYQIVVVDKDGNAITGTNTIESFPWGNDIFVEGIPLTTSGELPFNTKPGHRRRSPLSMQIGIAAEKVQFASGAFSASLIPAEFQFIVNIVDYRLSATEAVSLPRFGTYAWDMNTRKSAGGIWLDPRVNKKIVETLAKRGLAFTQTGYIDTGLGAVAIVKNDGTTEGAIAPMTSSGQRKIVGIGAALGTNNEHKVFVQQVYADSPAEKAGLVLGDILVSVQPTPSSPKIDLKGKTSEDVLSLLKGEKDVPLIIEIRRPSGGVKTFEIIRREFVLKKK